MMRKILIPALIVCLNLISGCTPYRPTIQQGNILDADQYDKLKTGMTRSQVTFLMGTPLLKDPFHKNRWDYLHTVKPGDNKITTIQRLTLYFDNDKLVRIDKSELAKHALN
jgi:outer membrane protein assembly factor BamE